MAPHSAEVPDLPSEAEAGSARSPVLATAPSGWQQRLLHPAFLFVAILAVLIIRCPDALRFPELAYEDGNQMLGFYFNSPEMGTAFRVYNGYVQLVPNLIAWGCTRGPVTLAPQLFTLCAMTLAALGMCLVATSRMAWLIPSKVDRALVALLLVLVPLGKSYVVYNVAYSLWSCLFLLIVLVAGPLPQSKAGLVACSIGIVAMIFSHPLSLIVLPILGLHLVLEKRWPQRLCAGLFILAIVAYQIFGVEHGAAVNASLSSAHLSVKLFLSRVVFEMAVGPMAGTTLIPENAQFVHYAAVTLLLFLGFLTLTSPASIRVKLGVGIAVGLAFGLVFASTAARLANGPDAPHVFKFYLQRYFYVPKLILMTLLLGEILRRLRLTMQSVSFPAAAALGMAGVVYLTALNRANNRLYRNVHEDGVRIANFLGAVDQQVRLAKAGLPYVSDWKLPRQEGWEMTLNIDSHLGRSDSASRRIDDKK